MTLLGWLFMLTSWTVIIGVLALCLVRTLRGNNNGEPAADAPAVTEGATDE